ncbi:MAG: leucine--tRNA ligase [Clostridium sp.]
MSYSVETDKKWQKKWDDTKLYEFDKSKADNKLYCLEMFSYPSGAKLHAGHWYNYGPTDTWARFKRMQGYNVFQPMGFDAFGLPAENYAIKTGVHPHDSTMKNIETMEKQLREMGAMFNWENELVTCLPEYYKWTQWIFLKFYEAGLAYRKEAPVNWCPSCATVLANEQVLDGECERCSSAVTKKNLTQWFFNITKYADELLDMIDGLDWPEKTKKIQKNWIGRSEGAEIEFKVDNSDVKFDVFTTRADTLYGVTYVVIAPESPIVDMITTAEQKEAVENYKEEAAKQTEIERMSTSKEKSGVFTGAYAIHPLTGEKVQIWISDYVLATYGTGCVMAVPAHDERDFEFATKFNLPIKRVIESAKGEETTLPFTEYGKLVNSMEFDGIDSATARVNVVKKAEKDGKGELKINFRLRDWLVSRQRYWGCPIPIIHCDDCGAVPVPETSLPVELPYDVEFTPDGESPLKKCESFVNTACPKCGKPAKREADTLDTFVCSSWYFLRYPDNKNTDKAFDTEWINKMLPVDKYVGGPEHAAMHLLYARFFTKALRDLGYLNFDEPFKSLVHQGIILGPDGNKMSKSKGNVISPDEYVSEHGSDVFRMYLMFGFGYADGGPWNVDGIKAMSRFVSRIERAVERYLEIKGENTKSTMDKEEKELNLVLHTAIKGVLEDTDKFQFNTSIARLMELVNGIYKYDSDASVKNAEFLGGVIKDLIKLLAAFAPHLSEDLWEMVGEEYSIFNQSLPVFDESALVRDTIELGVQINGKVRGKVEVSNGASDEEIQTITLNDEKIKEVIEGKEVKKVIVIKGRLVNIVVK